MLDFEKLKSVSCENVQSVQLTTLTPMFMHGWQKTETNPRNDRLQSSPIDASLRVPSFRGVIRYWWRTLQSYDDYRELLGCEQATFGGTAGSDESGCRSPISFQVKPLTNNVNKKTLCPHKGGMPSLALPERSRICLSYRLRQNKPRSSEQYRAYIEYTMLLASFGQRARRGAGAVQYDGFQWNRPQDILQSLRGILEILHKAGDFELSNNGLPQGLVLQRKKPSGHTYPRLQRVWLGTVFQTAEQVRTRISDAGHQYNKSNETQYLGNISRGGSKRLASPLWCTVREIGNGYYPLVSELSGPHMDDRNYIEKRNGFLNHFGVNV